MNKYQEELDKQVQYFVNMSDKTILKFQKELQQSSFKENGLVLKAIKHLFGEVSIATLQAQSLVWPMSLALGQRLKEINTYYDGSD